MLDNQKSCNVFYDFNFVDLGNGEVNLMQFSTILGFEKINLVLEQSYY